MGSVEKRFVCARVQPRIAAAHQLHPQITFLKIQPVEIRYFQFTPC